MKTFLYAPLMLLSTIVVDTSWAGRSMLAPPLRVSGKIDLTKNGQGTAVTDAYVNANWGTPARIGNIISAEIELTNLSALPQTGTMTLVGNKIQAAGYCSFGADHYFLRAVVVLCGSSGGNHADAKSAAGQATNAFETQNFPSPVTWSLGGNSNIILKAQLWLEGTKGTTATTGCPYAYAFLFSPKIKIQVNEERGAIIGTLNYYAGSINESAGSATCSGSAFNNSHFGGDAPDFIPLPLSLNGGRPF